MIPTSNDLRRLGFPFRSGRLCLDFVATVAKRAIADHDMLVTPEDLETWFQVAELPPARGRITHEGLEAARELREAIHRLTRTRVDKRTPPRAAIRTVNTASQAGTPTSTLGLDGLTAIPAPSAPLEAILSTIARDAIDLFSGPYAHRIRACLGHDCSLFFVDRSRPGSRRWCAMAACGEKASSAAYRRRHTSRP
ncbi:MAG TPA: ABATE domain-containing protein [Amycolatopsis sp.]|uniref:CGNR zinc finger domain-containing protein n=1 Tax=Amycolatopsis sp. TaxID=37632 RepID=UPI002B4612DD|nr:ABATE domain-containing protein [Amycolatopsis sp.]HKS47340.1 ABATE domain-containing protein [Amycolatopsis sp.]